MATKKKKIAEKLISSRERRQMIRGFNTSAWMERKESIAKRVHNQQKRAHIRAIARKNKEIKKDDK